MRAATLSPVRLFARVSSCLVLKAGGVSEGEDGGRRKGAYTAAPTRPMPAP